MSMYFSAFSSILLSIVCWLNGYLSLRYFFDNLFLFFSVNVLLLLLLLAFLLKLLFINIFNRIFHLLWTPFCCHCSTIPDLLSVTFHIIWSTWYFFNKLLKIFCKLEILKISVYRI